MANSHSLDLELSSSQYASVADNANVSVTGDITMECWIKLEQKASTAGSHFHLVNKWLEQGDKRSYGLYISSIDDKLYFLASDNGTIAATHWFRSHSTTALTTIGTWIHIAVSFDISAEDCHFYFNGVEEDDTVDDSPIGVAIVDNDSQFSIGCVFDGSGDPVRFLDGKIDEVRLWNDVRTEAEIADNKDKELIGNEANLVGYWRLNSSYADSCKSSDLTASGSPIFSTDVPFVGAMGGFLLNLI